MSDEISGVNVHGKTWSYLGWPRKDVPLGILALGIKTEDYYSHMLASELYRRADAGLLPEVVPPEVAEILMQRAAGV